jgi:2-polyprenyl-3-methyl-5-hydroxy-6-metoxy-1,4-benzoquinol methylase
MPHDLSEIQKNWDHLGKVDPLNAIKLDILHENGEIENKKDSWTFEDFFLSGSNELDSVLKQVSQLNYKLSYSRALDFGCGIGRVTQALATHFENVDGIDIAPSMIDLAKSYNRSDRVHYTLNNKNSLDMFDDNTFDFIYSVGVLQHMHPRFQENYLSEFLRILSPDGLLFFELPSEYKSLKQKILFNFMLQDIKFAHIFYWKKIRKGESNFASMQFYCNPRSRVEPFLLQKGAKNIQAIRNYRDYVDYDYFVTKY